MIQYLEQSQLGVIARKVREGERLSRADGIKLWQSHDLLSIGMLSDHARRRKVGDDVFFINNTHINHTNICRNLCELCAFGKKPADSGAYTLSLEEIAVRAEKARGLGVSEVHIVGGLNEDLPFDYYLEMLRIVRDILPEAHIQAFDAVEIDFLSEISGLGLEEVLLRLKESGLGSLPGGGAEIFNAGVREKICGKKIGAARWLEVHETAHKLGFRSNATMLYGHLESIEDRVDHLLALRELQDRTGGFLAFIPLAFHPANTSLAQVPKTTGMTDLKALAIARLMLDNFQHIKAFWIMITPRVAQVALSFGVNDLDGTVREERIVHEAGAETAQYQPAETFLRMIREAGRTPVERDTLYKVVRRYDKTSTA
ncbi:MAG: aminofutalosine synthase MqnE [Desulfotomaculaceae bacterium]